MHACLYLAAEGKCKWGRACRFSHTPHALDQLPLYNGRLPCPGMIREGFCDDRNCPHSHELRSFVELKRVVNIVKHTGVREQLGSTPRSRANNSKSRAGGEDAPISKRKRHESPAGHQRNAGSAADRRRPPKKGGVHNVPCVYYAISSCSKGERCPAIHNADLVPRVNGKYPCPHMIVGRCFDRENCPYSHTIDGIDSFIALCKESGSFVPDSSDLDISDDESVAGRSGSDDSDDSISEDGKDYPELRYPGRDNHGNEVAGDILYGRFAVICKLGKGVFSKVVLAHDTVTASVVALKVFRGSETYCQAADDEMRIYSKLQANSGGNDYCFLRALAYVGAPHPHHAIVFPVGGLSLFEIIKTNTRVFRELLRGGKLGISEKDRNQRLLAGARIRGFPLETVRSFLFQLLRFVCYAHSQGIVLTDIKTENIILSTSIPLMRTATGISVPAHTGIAVIDMGNAVELLDSGYAPDRQDAQTRHYRAPEVVLDCAYSLPVDIWSVGVLVPELLTGVAPFMTHDNQEHLALMTRVVGHFGETAKLPTLITGRRFHRYFDDRDGKAFVRWPPRGARPRDVAFVRSALSIWEILETCGNLQLIDLVRKMLRYEPSERITAAEALEHPFFTGISQ